MDVFLWNMHKKMFQLSSLCILLFPAKGLIMVSSADGHRLVLRFSRLSGSHFALIGRTMERYRYRYEISLGNSLE